MAAATFTKDPAANLDYSLDWTQWLAGDLISVSAWTVPAGITEGATANSTTTTTVWLSDGDVGEVYSIVNHITTLAGRQDSRTIVVQIKER
jgi:hypothetical protein